MEDQLPAANPIGQNIFAYYSPSGILRYMAEINFTDRNAVEKFLDGKQFRHCANLRCNPLQLQQGTVYMPFCMESRFKREGVAEFLELPSPPRPLSPLTYTTIPTWAPLVSCPADCKGYRNRTVAKVKKTIASSVRTLLRRNKAESAIERKRGWWETWWGQAVMLIVTGVIAGLILWGVARHYEKKTSLNKSSVNVVNITGVHVKNQETGRIGFAFNVYYVNKGEGTATALTHRTIIASSPNRLSDEELEAYRMKGRLLVPPDPKAASEDEIQPGLNPQHFFSIPENDSEIEQFEAQAQDTLNGKTRLYIFVTMKYLDAALLPNQGRVTEFCGWFLGTFDMWHDCGNRIYTENLPKAVLNTR